MNKITLLLLATMVSFGLFAQQVPEPQDPTTSFEQSEGYELGTLDGQNGWVAQDPDVGPDYADLMVVSDEQSSDGDYALKLKKDTGGILGQDDGEQALRALDIPSDANAYSISFDIYLSDDGQGGQGQVIFADASGQGDLGGFVIGDYSSQGAGQIIASVAPGQTIIEDFQPTSFNQFVHCKVVFNVVDQEAEFYADETLLATYSVSGPVGLMAVLNFGASSVYVDNIVGEEEEMGVEDFDTSNFTYYTKNNTLYMTGDSQIDEVAVYNMLGQEVATQTVNGTSGELNIADLSSGVYIAKVSVNGDLKSFKFSKI